MFVAGVIGRRSEHRSDARDSKDRRDVMTGPGAEYEKRADGDIRRGEPRAHSSDAGQAFLIRGVLANPAIPEPQNERGEEDKEHARSHESQDELDLLGSPNVWTEIRHPRVNMDAADDQAAEEGEKGFGAREA